LRNEMGGETRFLGASVYDFDSDVKATGNIIAYAT